MEAAVEVGVVDAVEAAAGLESRCLVEVSGVGDVLVFDEVLADAVEPFLLFGRELVAGVDGPEGLFDPFFVGDQWFAQGSLADEADDAGGDLLVGLLCPGFLEGFGAVALAGELLAQLLEGLTGELAGALGDDLQGFVFVEVGSDVGLDFSEVVRAVKGA